MPHGHGSWHTRTRSGTSRNRESSHVQTHKPLKTAGERVSSPARAHRVFSISVLLAVTLTLVCLCVTFKIENAIVTPDLAEITLSLMCDTFCYRTSTTEPVVTVLGPSEQNTEKRDV